MPSASPATTRPPPQPMTERAERELQRLRLALGEARVPRIPATAFVLSLGLIIVAVADGIARSGSGFALELFWIGMLVMWVPVAVRALGATASRSERIALLLLLGIALYIVKILYSPRYFSGHDEFLHWRTAEDILVEGRPFTSNPILPVSPLYPGLELATSALASLTGLSVFVSGTILLASGRVVTILALFLLYERVGGSARLASIAVLVYLANPHFLYFDASFAYESLALPFSLVVLYALARGQDAARPSGFTTLLVVLPLAAAVVTHHVTSFILAATLLLAALAGLPLARPRVRSWNCAVALGALTLVALWLGLVAPAVLHYLEPTLGRGVAQVLSLVTGEETSRELFKGPAGQTTSRFDTAASLGFTLLTVAGLGYGMLRVLYRARLVTVFTVVFAVTALGYPASGLFRLTAEGAELGDRIAPFVFVPVAFFVGAAAMAVLRHAPRRSHLAVAVAATAALLYGGVAIAAPAWDRMPGPYLVGADSHSIEPEGISDAAWAKSYLGTGNRVAADRVNRLFMLTYGQQFPVTEQSPGIDLAPVFFRPALDDYTRSLLARGRVRYVVIDRRLSESLPKTGVYIHGGEPGALAHRKPIARGALGKFDRSRLVSRVLDSGHISIYDVQELER